MTIFSKSFLSLFLILLFLSFFITNVSLAANDYQLGAFAKKAGYSTTGAKADLEPSVRLVINTVLSLTGILFLVLAVYAGVRWMTAQGNTEAVTKAQETLQAAIIGMIVVSMSYAITTVVFNSLSNKIPTGNELSPANCTKDSDCKTGEKCSPIGTCFSNNCSDPVFQCGGCGGVKCPVGKKCSILSDCETGNCNNGVCSSALNCSNYKNLMDCPDACDWKPTNAHPEGECIKS